MKSYFLALRNEDFNVSSNLWTSNSIDLYANKFYTNYSTYKSRYGNNALGDFTFTGTAYDAASPTIPNALHKTNYGEIVQDKAFGEFYVYDFSEQDDEFFYYDVENAATPYRVLNPSAYVNLLRFVDTTSSVDIVGFKHAFTNLPGTEQPIFTLDIISSKNNSSNLSEWRSVASVNHDTNVLFLRNVDRYVKFIVNFNIQSDITNSNFLLLVQTQIQNILSPVITDHTRNMLSRFPGWTKLYQDSEERATPELALAESVGGKFLNALVGENLDNIEGQLSKFDLNYFITTADIDQLDWIYLSKPVAAGFIKVLGDGIELARLGSYEEILSHTKNDRVFYYNHLTSELFTTKEYTTLYTDTTKIDQIPIQFYNSFDEFGLRVGLQRMYLEPNLNFKLRILDVYQNPPDVTIEGLKRTLRRELDIWRAYSSTPNSNYPGATPEIYEMQDLLIRDDYFDSQGNPKRKFFDFVEDMNKKYPTNFGYIKWGEAYWDYAGALNEGVSRIPQVTDATPLSTVNYQYGIGDFEDAKLVLEKLDLGTKEYEFGVRVHGYKYDSVTSNNYEPIQLGYDSYVTYIESYVDNDPATVSYDIYLKLNQHGWIAQDAVYKVSVTDLIKNMYDKDSPSSPEYLIKEIFNSSGYANSNYIFKSFDSAATPYINNIETSATESYTLNQIPLYAVQQATVNQISSKNLYGQDGDNSFIEFSDGTRAIGSNSKIVKTFSNPNYSDGLLRLVSNIYSPKKYRTARTAVVRFIGEYTVLNSPSITTQTSKIVIKPEEIIKMFSIPSNVTPLYVYIENVIPGNYTKILGDKSEDSGEKKIFQATPAYGGISLNRDDNSYYLIPSSPNINISFINPNFATPDLHPDYLNTVSSTVNYSFHSVYFPYLTTPDYIVISSNDSDDYPFTYPVWKEFSADSIEQYSFAISDKGILRSSPNNNLDFIDSKNQDIIDYYNFYRTDFGLEEYSSSPNLYISSIEILNDSDDVNIWTDYSYVDSPLRPNSIFLQKETYLNYWDSATSKYTIKNLPIRAAYNYAQTKYVSPSVKTGWYYLDEPTYIYAKPKTEISVGEHEIILDQPSRKGSPIIVSVVDSTHATTNYKQVSFFDEATPWVYSYQNFEYVTAKDPNVLYLAYSNIFDATVIDQHTGQKIIENYSAADNRISIISIPEYSPFIIGREYKVTYRVKQVFVADNQYYNTEDNSYRTKVTLLSTPNGLYNTYVTFESAIKDDDYELSNVVLNPIYSALDEGFLYLSHDEYEYSSPEYSLSPRQVLADNKDYMTLNIFSKDVYGNPKPYQDYTISGTAISATPSTIKTNIDGYANSKIRYVGSNVPLTEKYYFVVVDPNDYHATIEYYVKPVYDDARKVTSEVDSKIITADGLQKVKIIGATEPNVSVYWRRSRDLKDLFDKPYSLSMATPGQYGMFGKVVSNSNGYFEIGDFIAHPDATPGYWFVSTETNFNNESSTPSNTIAGDIVYWYEKYDSVQSELDEPVFENILRDLSPTLHYNATPAFKIDIFTEQPYYNPNVKSMWNLPDWYPIDRYTQYEMGLLGATPYVVEKQPLNPDYEEE